MIVLVTSGEYRGLTATLLRHHPPWVWVRLELFSRPKTVRVNVKDVEQFPLTSVKPRKENEND